MRVQRLEAAGRVWTYVSGLVKTAAFSWMYSAVDKSPPWTGPPRQLARIQLDVLGHMLRIVGSGPIRDRLMHEQVHPIFLDLFADELRFMLENGHGRHDETSPKTAAFCIGIAGAVFDHLDRWPVPDADLRDAVASTLWIWRSDVEGRPGLFRRADDTRTDDGPERTPPHPREILDQLATDPTPDEDP